MKIQTFLTLAIASLFVSLQGLPAQSLTDEADIPVLGGESKLMIPAKQGLGGYEVWYFNDHCFVTDKEGVLHCFGINNPFPPANKYLYDYHPFIGHLQTTDVTKTWKRQPHALSEEEGTEFLGAPFVIYHKESGRWVMVLETKLEDVRRLELAWSDDLTKWQRTKEPILPDEIFVSSRDPHIMVGDDGTYWIHVASSKVIDGIHHSQIIRMKTKDFKKFEITDTLVSIPDNISWIGIESPFLLQRKGVWYLFYSYAHRKYDETIVVVSKNPNKFDYRNHTITTIFGHAPEIFSYQGKTYITSCGPEGNGALNTHGITSTELKWLPQK